jgi:hypothetical protein
VKEHFDVAALLTAHRTGVLARAADEVTHRRLPHYEAAGRGEIEKRLASLFDVVVTSASERRLEPALVHADTIAAERHQTGHDLHEIQRAINALEEQLWQLVFTEVPAAEQGYVLGVVSTVLGGIKDRLACEYLSRATSNPVRTLRIDELFRGTEGDF